MWEYSHYKKCFTLLKSINDKDNFMIWSWVDPAWGGGDFRKAVVEEFGTTSSGAERKVDIDWLVWHRTNAINAGGSRFTSSAEILMIAYIGGRLNSGATWNRARFSNASINRHNVIDMRELQTAQKYKYPFRSENADQPLNTMQKPVHLYWYLLQLLVREGGNVLCLCSGSGSMAISAAIHRCNCDSVDIDPDQFNGSLTRFKIELDRLNAPNSTRASELTFEAVEYFKELKRTKPTLIAQLIKHGNEKTQLIKKTLLGRLKSKQRPPCEAEGCEQPNFEYQTTNAIRVCSNFGCQKVIHAKTCAAKFMYDVVATCSSSCVESVQKWVEEEMRKAKEEADSVRPLTEQAPVMAGRDVVEQEKNPAE